MRSFFSSAIICFLAAGVASAETKEQPSMDLSELAHWSVGNSNTPHENVNLGKRSGNDNCPPCFNCNQPGMECSHFGDCNKYAGFCACPPGFGGADCSDPLCGSLPRGTNRPQRTSNATCSCDEGWQGINCNMCESNKACDALMPVGQPGTCYKGGLLVRENFHMCDVTNRKIADMLKEQKAQVTFGCNRNSSICDLQLWVDEQESFFCKFTECDFKENQATNATNYECQRIQCECVPHRLLCGADGSIDLSQWLRRSVKGPGRLKCDNEGVCSFQEPEMNKLIKYVFGDNHIDLQCSASECLHYSEVPGYHVPQQQISPVWAAGAILLVVSMLLLTSAGARRLFNHNNKPASHIPPIDPSSLVNQNPIDLQFENISYSINGRPLLQNVFGYVNAGSILAIMGGSGAGKTTLLDILARKQKLGQLKGSVYFNGVEVDLKTFRRHVGYVDQEDELLPTLTVYETVVTSALLRLPKSMSVQAKRLRALDTLTELGILHLRDQLIGSETKRGLSGGEKRRVAIACELVTSPSIIFLDEPTSGLDAFNAFNVVECLVRLARDFNRTVVFTIHQPRSNIVSLFDRMLLLAEGQLVFEGTAEASVAHFASLGHQCPPGYNIADFLIDMTMKARQTDINKGNGIGSESQTISSTQSEPLLSNFSPTRSALADCQDPEVHTDLLLDDPVRTWRDTAYHQEAQKRQGRVSLESSGLSTLVEAFTASSQAMEARQCIARACEESAGLQDDGYERIGVLSQFAILSERTFKNLYRDPMLVFTHYLISIFLGLVCGVLYYHVKLDISGFQNRLGLFFFLLSLFGFSTLTTISLFARERSVFLRERANGYYSPGAYYASKVLLDVIPLRVIPPLMLGIIVYPLVGLNFDGYVPLRFLAVLVLFNLSASTIMLVVGILVRDQGVATLAGCLINLFGILFAGLFLNQETMSAGTSWMRYASIYHYAYEALSVNEVRYLSLSETRFGLNVEVPGATILSAFGFDNEAVPQDIAGLAVISVASISLGYVILSRYLVEQR